MANGTNITASSEAAVPESNGNQTFLMTSQPQTPPPESHAPASHTPNTSNNTTTTTTSPIHTTHSTSVVTLTTAPLTTHHSAPTLHDSVTPSNHSTSAPTPEPPKPESSTTTIITNSISMPITSSSHETPNSESTAHTSPQTTSQASKAHLEKTSNPPSSPTAKAESLADLSSKLNAGDVKTIVHDSPTLDPLLAGLVSAFIITAVIITLLLFLKLRRRDNRPEFRRLQDLPMDDMMEDTPLSMYSY
ncbi:uncharacterized protein LOC134869364 isoform X4 [Eleginops maclovinus]